MKIIRVAKCEDKEFWYHDSIGKLFKVYDDSYVREIFVLCDDVEDGKARRRTILKTDCEILEER